MSDADLAAAVDPRRHAVVESCAGAGKTWMLVSRIVRALLDGAEPSSILAITFTRKAAREMQGRLEDWLRHLARCSDEEALAFLQARHLSPAESVERLATARRLFETVLTARPGITISTFHGWFLELLQRAPIEYAAGAQSLAEVLSPIEEEAWAGFGELLASGRDDAAVRAFEHLVSSTGYSSARTLLGRFLKGRADWWAYTEGREDPVGYAAARVEALAGVGRDEDVLAEFGAAPEWRESLELYAGYLERNQTPTDRRKAAGVRDALATGAGPAAYEQLIAALARKTDRVVAPRTPQNSTARRLGAEGEQTFLALHDRIAQTLGAMRVRLAEQAMVRTNEAIFRCGAALLGVFQETKQRRGVIDFTDIEWQLCRLVTRSDAADYMLHRLDARYRHVLADEFQDTNPLQWQALHAWLEACAAAGDRPSVFLVGDPKQSVYRFRRAEARLFGGAAAMLERDYGALRLAQNVSRRCAPAVIEAVNRVFEHTDGLVHFVPHRSHDPALPGRAEVLPLARLPAATAPVAGTGTGLRNPLTTRRSDTETRAREIEAEQVAAHILRIVGRVPVRHGAETVPARFADVMVLSRRRTHLHTYEAALRQAGIPFVTSRHGGLLDRLEILDLKALLRFLVTPYSDLHLAHALRSPLFGCSDDELLALAREPGETWWTRLECLAAQGRASPALARAHERLSDWLGVAGRLPVHDLLDRIYAEAGAKARYRQAAPPPLRDAACANLDAFIALALELDAGRYPSLHRFLEELDELARADLQDAPDEGITDAAGDAVRILTVHGAKGLEAPVVYVIDAHATQKTESHEVLSDWPPGAARPALIAARTRKEEDTPSLEPLRAMEREHADREELNALYVAMTRASQWLVFSGSEAGRGGAALTWYRRVADALGAAGGDGGIALGSLPEGPAPSEENAPTEAAQVPRHWLVPNAAGTRGHARSTPETERGERIHALLELMAPPGAMTDPGALRVRVEGTEAQFAEALAAARAILEAPELRRFFDPARYVRARNEMSCVSAGGELRRMDRVVEFDREVWVLDYKTGEVPGESASGIAERYRDQMHDYAAVLRMLYPGRDVRAALVLPGGRLEEVSLAGPGV